MENTTLYVAVNDKEVSFEVPTDWLEKKAAEYNWTLEEFLSEYTSDESSDIYDDAFMEGLVSESLFERCATKTDKTCRFCGSPLYESDIDGYVYQCFKCDEDFYAFEQEWR